MIFEIGNLDLDFDITNDDMEQMFRNLNGSSVDVKIDEFQSERSIEFTVFEQEPNLKQARRRLCQAKIFMNCEAF